MKRGHLKNSVKEKRSSATDALVVEVIIHNFKIQKILMDDGSKVNLLP